MKRYTMLAAAALLGTTLVTSACDEGLAEINENPNAPTDVPAQYLLPNGIVDMVEFAGYNTWYTLEFTGLFAQHWAKIQYTSEDQYALRENVVDGFWSNFYTGPMKDWELIIQKGIEGELANYQAIGMIGKSYMTHLITDTWGDVPYTEALKGDAEEPITAPAYDTQEAIYTAMLADLATAAGMLDPAARTFGQEDLLYGGDVAQWEMFANSLRLRLAMRISDVAAGTAQPIVEALASQPLILDNADNAGLAYLEASPNQNPYYENAAGALGGGGSRDDHAVSNTLIGMMGALNDPRIPVFAEPAADDSLAFDETWCGGAGQMPCHITYNGEVYRGMRNGVDNSDVPKLAIISRIGSHFRANPSTPQYILTAAEVNFLLAEAALNGWNVGGTAQSYYEAGVRANFAMWNGADGVTLDAAAADAYLATPGVQWGTGDSNAELIAEQKWLALYSMPWEAYAEYRRTGYPDEIVPAEAGTLTYVPGRIPYPNSEQSLNSTNLQQAISNQSTNGTYQGKVWWDPNAPS